MQTKRILTSNDVAAIARTAKSTKSRTRLEAWTMLKLTSTRLAGLSSGELEIAPDVRLPKDAIVRLLWTIRKQALAQHKAHKAQAEAAPAAEAPAAPEGAALLGRLASALEQYDWHGEYDAERYEVLTALLAQCAEQGLEQQANILLITSVPAEFARNLLIVPVSA